MYSGSQQCFWIFFLLVNDMSNWYDNCHLSAGFLFIGSVVKFLQCIRFANFMKKKKQRLFPVNEWIMNRKNNTVNSTLSLWIIACLTTWQTFIYSHFRTECLLKTNLTVNLNICFLNVYCTSYFSHLLAVFRVSISLNNFILSLAITETFVRASHVGYKIHSKYKILWLCIAQLIRNRPMRNWFSFLK